MTCLSRGPKRSWEPKNLETTFMGNITLVSSTEPNQAKLELAILASHSRLLVQVLVALLLIQLSASVSKNIVADGLSTWAPASPVENSYGVPSSWSPPTSLESKLAGGRFPFSLYFLLHHSAFQTHESFLKMNHNPKKKKKNQNPKVNSHPEEFQEKQIFQSDKQTC